MKLNIVPARTGIQWVKLGIRTFFKRPLALASLFFIYAAGASFLSLVPYIGWVLALAIVPAATLGLMAATEDAATGHFPMPTVLLSAFRAGRERMRAMLVLGLLYAGACIGVTLLANLLAGIPAGPVQLDQQAMLDPRFQLMMLVTMVLYLPVSLLFWHAPALVHWHGISPLKSLFFSLVACWRNAGALTLYGLGWGVVILAIGILLAAVAVGTGQPEITAGAVLPLGLLVASMFSTSLYFTFRDSFVATPEDDPQPNGESP
jgi:uncharacterized membrane protein (DUF441 family)